MWSTVIFRICFSTEDESRGEIVGFDGHTVIEAVPSVVGLTDIEFPELKFQLTNVVLL
jgi:hypothetical protein